MNLHSDRPIKSTRHDLLGRKILAKNIAKSLAAWKGDESLVLALNGPWGSGKSSVKNMVIESLRLGSDEPIIVDFNPWEIAGSQALTEELFNTIAESIPNKTEGSKAEESAKRLQKFGRGLGKAASVAKAVSSISKGVGFFIPGAGVIAEIFDHGGEKLKEAADKAQTGADALKSENEDRSLSDQKHEITQCLTDLNRPFIVMIDDIDRLSSDEICLLFRLIKANCDFPNFAFLLLFDRSYVCSALDQITNNCGAEYLEKIVQVSLTIGIPDRDLVRKLLKKEVLSLLPPSAKREPIWNDERWNLLVDYHVVEGLRHIRDVRRLVNAFSVSLASLSTRNHCEVNPIDLLLLEHIRLTEPALYESLPRYRWILVGESNLLVDHLKAGVLGNPVANSVFKASIQRQIAVDRNDNGDKSDLYRAHRDEILSTLSGPKHKQFEVLLASLFPKCPAFRTKAGQSATIRALQVGHPEMFDVYFHRAIPMRRISQARVGEVVRQAKHPKRFLAALQAELKAHRHELLIEHLTERADDLMKHGVPMLQALVEFSENLAVARNEQFHRQSVPDLFLKCILCIETAEERWRTIAAVVERTSRVRLLADFAADAVKKEVASRAGLLPVGCLPDFQKLLSEHFNANYSAALDLDARDLVALLFRWRDTAGIEAVRVWLRRALKNTKEVWRILYACSSPVIDGRLIHGIAWNRSHLKDFLPKEEWLAAASAAKPIGKHEESVSEAFWILLNDPDADWGNSPDC